MMRANSFDSMTLQLTQRMFGALNNQPSLLSALQLTGVSAAIAPGSVAATQAHLEPLRAQLIDYGLPGFAASIECLEGALSNTTRCRSPPPRKPCRNYRYSDMREWTLEYQQDTDLGSIVAEIT
jgi:hypothetical protein